MWKSILRTTISSGRQHVRRKRYTHVTAYLIQFGNIMPIERINDYREDMKLSGPAGRVNCHYPVFPTEREAREREKPAAFWGKIPLEDLNY